MLLAPVVFGIAAAVVGRALAVLGAAVRVSGTLKLLRIAAAIWFFRAVVVAGIVAAAALFVRWIWFLFVVVI